MATDDTQVQVAGQAAAPANYVIPGNGQIRPKVIFAKYDGTATATDYQPAVKVTSDAGLTVGIFPALPAVTAGGSVNVSWFPGVDEGDDTTTSGGGSGTLTQLTSSGATIAVGNSTGPITNLDLPATGVTAATYGDATHVAQVTVDAQGRLTAAANVAASGGAGLVKIFDQTLLAPAATIDTGAGGIPAGYSGLMCYCLARRSDAVASASLDLVVNNDTGANYNQLVTDNSTGVMAPAWGTNITAGKVCEIPGSSMAANFFAYAAVWIPFYSDTVAFKGWVSSGGFVGTAVDAELVEQTTTWRNTAAITRLTFQPSGGVNLVTGSRVTIYGLP